MNDVKIIQSSYGRSGSTILVNLIHGALCPEEATHFRTEELIDEYMITKTHNIDFDKWMKEYPDYNLYFIASEREGGNTKNDTMITLTFLS
jgi:hypothetical protein